MKKITRLVMVALAAMLFLASCQPKEQKVYIVSTNDMHANIDYFPQLAALVDSLRSVHPDLLLFGAGDNRSGNPVNDRYEEVSKPMYELMNAVGFDLSTFGNHEWDAGVLALRDVLTWAKFPFVCANVTFDDSLQMPNTHPYVVIERRRWHPTGRKRSARLPPEKRRRLAFRRLHRRAAPVSRHAERLQRHLPAHPLGL